jgi:hypothetical protein
MAEKDYKAGLRRIYRKSWPYDNIYGSSRFEFSATNRGIWNDLLDLAKLSRVEPGLIAPGPGQAYPHQWIAGLLNVPLEDLDQTIELLKKTNRISENHDGIRITNWTKYQTEYDRQKPWREAKKERDYTGKGTKYEGIMKLHQDKLKEKKR